MKQSSKEKCSVVSSKHLWVCLVLGASWLLTAQSPANGPSRLQVIGYITEWGIASGEYTLKTMAISGAPNRLTQLDYAFGRVADNHCQIANQDAALLHTYDGSASVDGTSDSLAAGQLRGTFHQLQELKHRYPNLRVVISLGGWGGSGGFSSAADPEHLRDFVRSCIDIFIKGQFGNGIVAPGIFDGVDLDWEYPVDGGVHPGRPEDKANFSALAREFRRQLDAVRPGLLLTAALPAEEEYYRHFDLKEISKWLDSISIMAYDLHWNTEPVTNFHSALYHDAADPSHSPMDKRYGDYAVLGFLRAGVPAKKLILGVPFYGKGWLGVKDLNHGLYQQATGPAQSGGSYRELKNLPAETDRQYYRDAVSCTVWNDKVFWSYDCPESLRAKLKYVKEHQLGGTMFWELSQDTPDLELLRTLTDQ